MSGHQNEAHALKSRLQQAGRGRGEFNELKTHQSHRVFKQIRHDGISQKGRRSKSLASSNPAEIHSSLLPKSLLLCGFCAMCIRFTFVKRTVTPTSGKSTHAIGLPDDFHNLKFRAEFKANTERVTLKLARPRQRAAAMTGKQQT